ncbi:MAG TPA: helix-turn-helix domain-containing protein, partial [Bellilinea sp.]|nr:helix-turn-helix domain-containing protein [Bellilinea sp.]
TRGRRPGRPRKATANPPNRIAELREKRGLTQDQLAQRVGTTNQTISRLERGIRRLNDVWIRGIADALGVDWTEIMNGGPQAPASKFPKIKEARIHGGLGTNWLLEKDGADAGWIKLSYDRSKVTVLKSEFHDISHITPLGAWYVIDHEARNLEEGRFYLIRICDEGTNFARRYAALDGPPRFEPYATEPGQKTYFPGYHDIIVLGQIVHIVINI